MSQDPSQPRRTRVLLAEDDEDIRAVFEMVLAEHFDVVMADNAEATLRLAIDEKPDVLLLDWTLPDADGDEVVARLDQTGARGLPLVIVSGSSSVQALAKRYGAIACPKPCDGDQLVSAVGRALASGKRGG